MHALLNAAESFLDCEDDLVDVEFGGRCLRLTAGVDRGQKYIMDRHGGEGYSDQSGSDHHSYSQSDDSFSNHRHHYHSRNSDNHRPDSSVDHHQSDEDDRCHRRHFNFSNEEWSNSPGAWEDRNGGYSFPLPTRKREFHHLALGPSPDGTDGGNVVKLYVGAVPRTVTEGDIRSVFGEHGNVIEVVLLKDKRTAQQLECCFVKYATVDEADRAIQALHGRYAFPGGRIPIKVKYADGKRDHPGGSGERVLTFKLYVGCVNKQASKREIEENVMTYNAKYFGDVIGLQSLTDVDVSAYEPEMPSLFDKTRSNLLIFSPFGIVEDVFIVRDEIKQPKGCAFVQFSHREMAIAAINALHGSYVMRGCEQPLVVRFADPKKPKLGDSRTAPYVGDRVSSNILPSYPHTPTCPESVDCDWSEHICPDGYPYYYNCITCESRWEKPEEYRLYEQQLLKLEQPQQCVAHP